VNTAPQYILAAENKSIVVTTYFFKKEPLLLNGMDPKTKGRLLSAGPVLIALTPQSSNVSRLCRLSVAWSAAAVATAAAAAETTPSTAATAAAPTAAAPTATTTTAAATATADRVALIARAAADRERYQGDE
jgi:hypothetical protein